MTICEKGINPEAQFRILKEDKNTGDTMTETESETMNELHTVLDRLSKRLDDADAAEATVKAASDAEKSEDKEAKEKAEDAEKNENKEAKEKMAYSEKDKDKMDKSDLDDVISTDYLQWLETTVKSAGYDPTAARSAIDNEEGVEKGYSPGEHGFDHRGQGSIEGAGEDDSGKRPKMNFGPGATGNKVVIKADDYISPENVTTTQLEEAYQVYKAAAMEQQFKTDLGNEFSMRFQKELSEVENAEAKASFDARGPLADLQKAVLSLADRIETIPAASGETITKSASVDMMTVPETRELAEMSWDDVHRMAGKALGGEN